jgi:hypothetical protein
MYNEHRNTEERIKNTGGVLLFKDGDAPAVLLPLPTWNQTPCPGLVLVTRLFTFPCITTVLGKEGCYYLGASGSRL